MKITTTEQIRRMDRQAMEEFSIPEEILMENAGRAAASVLAANCGIKGRRILVIAGTGNNGGDGLVVARLAHSQGGLVALAVIGDPERFQGAARINWEMVKKLPLAVHCRPERESLAREISRADFLVDAIFGTGLTREVEGIYSAAIQLINESGKKVLSLDLPSGINGDTGQVMGRAVRADYTVTFGLPKVGNVLYPGYALGGRLFYSPISYPPELALHSDLKVALNDHIPLPERSPTAHKGSVGEALIVAGSGNYYGAPLLAALSFLKAGGGYARLALPASLAPALAGVGSEIVFAPQKETASGGIARENRDDLVALAERADIVVIGPGLGGTEETGRLVLDILEATEKPVIVDGDGLTALSREPFLLLKRRAPTVLTPHLGEMSRLLKRSKEEIDHNRILFAREAAGNLKAILVLKGAHSLIACPEGEVFVNLTGNAGMATAGSGDILPGTIAAMYGQGLPLLEAVKKGVYLHGLAGDLAAREKGQDGIIARDIMESLPEALRQDRLGPDPNECGRCGIPMVL